MVPALPETPPADTEFDLDVRLQAVARHVSADAAEKPPNTRKLRGVRHPVHVLPRHLQLGKRRVC
jgi:hypothetical protein